MLRDIRVDQVHSTENNGDNQYPEDDLVINGVPVYGTIISGKTAESVPCGE